uniref:host specificity protein J n=1 Tax=Pseudomonas lundensis TaxID=86185 RepID=UPI0028D2ADC6|nr:DUF1983 domain-containing protein [Pseudomonas lundensis]
MAGQITGAKAGNKKPHRPSIASDSTPSLATAKLLFAYSWGEIVGPVNGLKSIKLDGTPIEAADGTLNFPRTKWQFQPGTLDQERLVGFPEINNEIAIGVELHSDTPWVRSVGTSQIDAIRLRLSWPQLQAQDSNGNITGYRIDYAVDIATDNGAYIPVLTAFVERKNTTRYERSHRIELPTGTNWLVRVRRLTPNQNNSLIADVMRVEAITEVIDAELTYPLTAVGGIEFDAEQFSNVPKVSAVMRGRILQVPSNYDAETRTYVGIWDGSFKLGYSNNPAWVWYDLVLHPYYGLGERITPAMVNRYALYRIAQWCDQMVSDGKGGLEPRFTCNLYLQTQQEAYIVLEDIASIFHGMSYWDGSQLVVTADMPEDPVYNFHRGNIISLKYQGIRKRDRHSRAMVSWDNPDNSFETEQEPVFDEASIAKFGVQDLPIGAVGCTSRGQAQRAGLFALISEKTQTRPATMRVGLDGQIPRPGQLIRLSDELLAGRANGGRISQATGRIITLDRDAEVSPGMRLICNLPSGVSETREVSSVDGRKVTIAAAYSEPLHAECGWVIDADDLATLQFKVMSITRPQWHQYQLTLLQHEPGKYDAVDHGSYIEPPPITVIAPGIQAPPTGVQISQHVSTEQGLAITTMTIAWQAADFAVAYEVEWRKGAGEWIRVPRTGDLNIDVTGIYSGQYLARVRAVNALGVMSIPANSVLTTLEGKTTPPSSVAFLRAQSMLFAIGLEWGFPAGAQDTQRSEIWYSRTPNHGDGSKLGDFAYPQGRHDLQGLAAGARFYFWARLVDRSGNVGQWYPEGNGVAGQASADAGPILDYLAGQIGASHLGQELLGEIELIGGDGPGSVNSRLEQARKELKELIDQVSDALAYDSSKTYKAGEIVRQRNRLYQARSNVSGQAPPDPEYWLDIGTVAETAEGLATQVEQHSTSIEQQGDQLVVHGKQLNAVTSKIDDPKTGLSATASGLSSMTSEVTRIGDNLKSISQHVDRVEASVGDAVSSVQQVSEALASTDGKLEAMWAVKMELTQDGQYVAAGFGLGIENTEAGLQSQFLVSADRFAMVNTLAGGQKVTPFLVQNGQMFINQAFIQDGSISMLKISEALQSNDYVPAQRGWRLGKTGSIEFNGPVENGGRLSINNRLVQVFDENGVLRVRMGIW